MTEGDITLTIFLSTMYTDQINQFVILPPTKIDRKLFVEVWKEYLELYEHCLKLNTGKAPDKCYADESVKHYCIKNPPFIRINMNLMIKFCVSHLI